MYDFEKRSGTSSLLLVVGFDVSTRLLSGGASTQAGGHGFGAWRSNSKGRGRRCPRDVVIFAKVCPMAFVGVVQQWMYEGIGAKEVGGG